MSAPRLRAESVAPLALALACEAPALAIRSVLVYIGCSAWLLMTGAHGGPWVGRLALLAPVAWPALALIAPFPSGWWWRHAEGGRAPSERERTAYQDSVAELQARAGGALRLPASWFVLDSPIPNAAVCAETLMLTRGLLEGDHLTAALAHELGHLAAGDGCLAAAISRLLLPRPRRPAAGAVHVRRQGAGAFALRLTRGGCGLRLAAPVLCAYWRACEYEADEHAAMLGCAEDLADFLEAHALITDVPAPLPWQDARAHPPAELRIGRLRAAAARERVQR